MRKQVVRICMLLACAFSFMQGQASIQPSIVKATIDELIAKDAKNQAGITKGVEQVARLWQTSDGYQWQFQRDGTLSATKFEPRYRTSTRHR